MRRCRDREQLLPSSSFFFSLLWETSEESTAGGKTENALGGFAFPEKSENITESVTCDGEPGPLRSEPQV